MFRSKNNQIVGFKKIRVKTKMLSGRPWSNSVKLSDGYFEGRSISYLTCEHMRRPVFRAVPAQGEHVPFNAEARYSFGMNTRLTETQIRRVCVELLALD